MLLNDQKQRITYSHDGEDLFILNLFGLMGISKPSYMDIGSNHPVQFNNTYLMYQEGCHGILVEPNPVFTPMYEQFRPKDKHVNVGVGSKPGNHTFYKIDNHSGCNSYCLEEVQKLIANNPSLKITEEKTFPVMTFNDVVKTYWNNCCPDFLNLDVEGWDYDVLSSIEWRLLFDLPKIICVEVRFPKTQEFIDLLEKQSYVCLARIDQNLIFVHEQFERMVCYGS